MFVDGYVDLRYFYQRSIIMPKWNLHVSYEDGNLTAIASGLSRYTSCIRIDGKPEQPEFQRDKLERMLLCAFEAGVKAGKLEISEVLKVPVEQQPEYFYP